MNQTRKAALRRLVATVGALVALGVAAVGSLAFAGSRAPALGAVERGSGTCELASVPAADSTVKDLRKSVRCLINQERAVHGFGKLARNDALQTAGQRHAKTMVDTGCLAHRCPDEVDLETRLLRAGYFEGADAWRYAENTGCGISAEAMVANWMASVYHRVNILDPEFDDIGVGVSQKRVADRCDKGYATFAVVFGHRSP
ncbi:MAG: hypothetical protein QOI10_1649 [Solirubrobacterales bacterium]|jgi:uncharacterized protein YkwD|nr:hypothetical protein [Solirubrobacterales bacterium]